MSEFHNPGDFRAANLIQGSQLNFPMGLIPARLQPEEIKAGAEQFAGLPLEAVPAPAALPAGSCISVRHNPLFGGRDRDLRQLATIIKDGEMAAAVTGLGGLGKTQLAAEFAHRYGQYFAGGVFWLNCSKAEDVPGQVVRCGGAEGLALREDFDDLPQAQQLALVKGVWSNPLPHLLILDNCEEQELLKQSRPTASGARVLLTSRKANWRRALGVQMLPLGVLTAAESVALLHQHRPDLAANDPELAKIAATLGHLPLALHLAGSYLERYRYATSGHPAVYLAELQSAELTHRSLSLVEGENDGESSPTEHELHVAHTFAFSWDQLNPDYPADALARRLLLYASCFAGGEPIPRDLLKASIGVTEAAVELERQAEDALGRALSLGLLEERADGALVLHRLLGAFVRRAAAGELPAALDAVEGTIEEAAGRLNQAGYPAPLTAWRAHLRAVAEAVAVRESAQAGVLLNELGYHLQSVAEFADARTALERALTIDEKVYGPEHPNVAIRVNNLGRVLQDLGDLAGRRRHSSGRWQYLRPACPLIIQAFGPSEVILIL